jgi:hypothetical protein
LATGTSIKNRLFGSAKKRAATDNGLSLATASRSISTIRRRRHFGRRDHESTFAQIVAGAGDPPRIAWWTGRNRSPQLEPRHVRR